MAMDLSQQVEELEKNLSNMKAYYDAACELANSISTNNVSISTDQRDGEVEHMMKVVSNISSYIDAEKLVLEDMKKANDVYERMQPKTNFKFINNEPIEEVKVEEDLTESEPSTLYSPEENTEMVGQPRFIVDNFTPFESMTMQEPVEKKSEVEDLYKDGPPIAYPTDAYSALQNQRANNEAFFSDSSSSYNPNDYNYDFEDTTTIELPGEDKTDYSNSSFEEVSAIR